MRRIFVSVIIIVLVFLGGVYVGGSKIPAIEKITRISGKEGTVATTADFSPFWKVWNDIDEKFSDNETISDQDRVYGAISGLVDSLNDPYSVFFTPDEAKMLEDDIAGSFGG